MNYKIRIIEMDTGFRRYVDPAEWKSHSDSGRGDLLKPIPSR